MKGGVTFFRSVAAAAVRTYFFSPEAVNSDYYLESTPEGHAERMTWTAEDGLDTGEIDADEYAAWVDFTDPETGESRGRVRKNSVRFMEKNINIDKSLSLAAAVNPKVAEAVNQAQRGMAEEMTAYAAEHFVTRVGPAGAQRQVGLEQLEVVTHSHAVSRENEPHPHLHWQVGARVYAEGGWRQLDTADAAKHSAALNALGENVLHADPQLRRVLAAEGYSFDPATGKVAELEAYVDAFSTRAAQIRSNKELLEQNWRADPANAGKTPGPRLRSEWDHMAWNGTATLEHIDAELTPRPQKTELADPELNRRWAAELAAMGFQQPAGAAVTLQTGIVGSVGSVGSVGAAVPDREELAAVTLAKLAGTRSAWSSADIRAEATRQLTASGYVAEPDELAVMREQLVGAIEGQCRSMADPRTSPGETARHWTTQSIIDTEDELKTRLAARAAKPAPGALTAGEVQELFPRLNAEQAEAAAALAVGTRLSVIEGYAGAGKTAVLGAAAEIRGADQVHEERPMLTVTPTLKAAQEARAAGAEACSLHKLLYANGYRWDQNNQWTRLAPGETDPTTGRVYQSPAEESPYHLAPDTQIVVDEAGMLDQEAARALLALVDEHDADLALMGDRAQLSAVGRGGVLDMAARVTTHHVELDQVHRFGADIEYAEISKKLRNREDLPETFQRLYQRGDLRIHATTEDAQEALAVEAATDIHDNREVALTVPTNAAAADLNTIIQAERITTGQITAHQGSGNQSSATGSDGLDIYCGDTVMTRSNNRELGVANRESFRVVTVHEGGALTIAGEDKRHRLIDAAYVAAHVHLGYAVTDYGNQGTTVDHGAVLMEEGMSGGGAYVGATRGRDDNTIHIVAEDADEARAKFIRIMGTDRADRGLEAARADLAAELAGLQPQPAPPPLSERVQRYVETLEQRRHQWERYAEYAKPLDEYQQQVDDFRARHGATLDQAVVDAGDAGRQARDAQQDAAQVYQQRRNEIYQHAKNGAGYQMSSLQTIEGHARNAGILDLKGHKPKARQMRDALEAEHGLEVPDTSRQRIKNADSRQDHDWVEKVAKRTTSAALPADPSVLRAQAEAHQAEQQYQHAAEHKKQITEQWKAEVGDKPDITLRRDRGQRLTYGVAARRIEELDQRISFASKPENQDQVTNQLEAAKQRREEQAAQAKAARARPRGPGLDPALDPHSPAYQAAYRPPSPTQDTGPDLGR